MPALCGKGGSIVVRFLPRFLFRLESLELRWLKIDPFLRKLRGDPRYTALLKKMNLPRD